MATAPGSARTEITFSLCVVRNSDRRRKTCSTVRFRAALEFQERRVRREGAAEQFGLKLELLQCAFAQALDLPEPVGFGRAVLRTN